MRYCELTITRHDQSTEHLRYDTTMELEDAMQLAIEDINTVHIAWRTVETGELFMPYRHDQALDIYTA